VSERNATAAVIGAGEEEIVAFLADADRHARATASLRGSAGYSAFAIAKLGLRAVAQSAARELGPRNIHVGHSIIDAAWTLEREIRPFAERW
jgi:hypothetical protein